MPDIDFNTGLPTPENGNEPGLEAVAHTDEAIESRATWAHTAVTDIVEEAINPMVTVVRGEERVAQATSLREFPEDTNQAIETIHAGFAKWLAAAREGNHVDMQLADYDMTPGFITLKDWLEQMSFKGETLTNLQRRELFSRILFGVGAADAGDRARFLAEFEAKVPIGSGIGTSVEEIGRQLDSLAEAFDVPEARLILIRILELSVLSSQEPEEVIAGYAKISGRKIQKTELLGQGGEGSVIRVTEADANGKLTTRIVKFSKTVALEHQHKYQSKAGAAGVAPLTQVRDNGEEHTISIEDTPDAELLKEYVGEPFIAQPFVAIAEQLQTLHEQCRIVHRDLKPGNILRVPQKFQQEGRDREKDRYLLIDFGFATDLPETFHGTAPVENGDIKGTPGFMPLEGLKGEFYSTSTDIYALGCIAFKRATGQDWYKRLVKTAGFETPEQEKGENDDYKILQLIQAQERLAANPGLYAEAFWDVEDDQVRGVLMELLQPEYSQRVKTAAEAVGMFKKLADDTR